LIKFINFCYFLINLAIFSLFDSISLDTSHTNVLLILVLMRIYIIHTQKLPKALALAIQKVEQGPGKIYQNLKKFPKKKTE
jgi:hypothetical protein